MLKIIILSALVSFIVSFSMMKFQMKMLEKWVADFFEEELDFIRKNLDADS
ncbi:hypothetical protein [Jeotgalibaca porci]|uniref:hypothetical protein n=1 Tax=Jeotgalibaca porci TaxID=1868793 RepID=UPI0035A10550